MKRYILSLGQSIGYQHPFPERTASKECDWDRVYQIWPNRKSMAKTIRMQQSGKDFEKAWKAVIALSDGEGY